MIVTVSGSPGAGKTAIAKRLAEALGYSFSSIADIRRRVSRERGVSASELEQTGENEYWTDDEIDEYLEEMGASYDNVVIASRFGFHLVPGSFKVLLVCDPAIAARRLIEAGEDRYGENLDEAIAALEQRASEDRQRGARFYGKDPHDPNNYDLVLDISRLEESDAVAVLSSGLGSINETWENSGPEHI